MRLHLLLLATITLSGCVTRGQIEAAIWMNNGLDPALCGPSKAESKYPELWDYGHYRRLNSGKFEFMPYCDPRSKKWLSMYERDFQRVMDGQVPQGPPKK